MPVMKKVQWTSLCRMVSSMEGKGAMLEPASKVRAIQGRSVLPRAISTAVAGGGEGGGRVGVGRGVSVGMGVGEGVTVKVGDGAGLGVLVKVAVGKAVGVAVGGISWEITGKSLIEDESHAGVSNSRDSRRRTTRLLVLKLKSPFNGTHDVAIGQIAVQIGPRAQCGSVITMAPHGLGIEGVFIAQPARQIDDGPQLRFVYLLYLVVAHHRDQRVACGIILGCRVADELQRSRLIDISLQVYEVMIGDVHPPPPDRPSLQALHLRHRIVVELYTGVMDGNPI